MPRMVCASFLRSGSFSFSSPAECHVLASPSKACTKPDVVLTCVSGFWFRIAAKTVDPERGMPDKKCNVFFKTFFLYADVNIAKEELLKADAIEDQPVKVPTCLGDE